MLEYTVDRIVKRVGTNKNIWFVGRLYGYTPQNDTIEASDHIPQHFVARYWSWEKDPKERHPRSTNQL